MKKILLTIFAGMLFSQVDAQYWQFPNIGANQNPGNLNNDLEQPFGANAGWDSIQAPNAGAVWSPIKTIPFAFNFNGVAVTQYKISTTGILTFDVATALAAPSAINAVLPSALIPNKSVVIWGVSAGGVNDKIITKTFGTAPNRQHWISLSSYSHGSNANIYSYWSVVLDETTNKIHIVDQRTGASSGAVSFGLTLGLQFTSASAMNVAGSPAVATTNNGQSELPDDNTYYSFIPGVQPAKDISANRVSAPGYFLVSNQNISIKVKNLGSSTITSYVIKYQDGTNAPVSQTVAASIATFDTLTTVFTTPLNVTLGAHPLKVWAELSGDNINGNDTLKTTYTGVASFPKRKVVYEEGTGTWCQWCPRGTIYMDSMARTLPNEAITIAVHNGDPMVVNNYDPGVGALISGYPSMLVDRKYEADPGDIFAAHNITKKDFGFADVSATHTIAGNNLSVTAKITPVVNMTGDYRVACVILEDRVHNATGGSTWNQANAYSGNATPMANAEYNFNTLPDPVPANKMYYDHVARAILNGFDGAAGTLPAAMTSGSSYTSPFTYTIPATYNTSRLSYAVLFIDKNNANSVILNAAKSTVYPLGFSDIVKNSIIEAVAYPNPATDMISLDFITTESLKASYSVLDITGKLIATKDLGTLSIGANTVDIATQSYTNGLYSIVITTNKGTFTSKFTKQ
jgi:hypothetical protein